MSLSEVGVPGQPVDVLHGGDVSPDGRLLSVAEIQQAFRELRQQRGPGAAQATAHTGDRAVHTHLRPVFAGPHTVHPAMPGPAHTRPNGVSTARAVNRFGPDWVVVLAAHSGAGASCVALGVAHAFAEARRPSRLIEVAPSSRSGLVAAAAADLGTDPTGAWRHGKRTGVSLYRPVNDDLPYDWPEPAGTEDATVVDLGLPGPEWLARLVADRPSVVAVWRPTVPGVRAVERLVGQLGGGTLVVAAVGPRRWPREVLARVGPLLRGLSDSGRVVRVPNDPRLAVAGATTSPLPKSVVAGGRSLLLAIDTAHGFVATPRPHGPRAPARHAHRSKGSPDDRIRGHPR